MAAVRSATTAARRWDPRRAHRYRSVIPEVNRSTPTTNIDLEAKVTCFMGRSGMSTNGASTKMATHCIIIA
jgi:hypothetical protein